MKGVHVEDRPSSDLSFGADFDGEQAMDSEH
jgi:hypothetical protein